MYENHTRDREDALECNKTKKKYIHGEEDELPRKITQPGRVLNIITVTETMYTRELKRAEYFLNSSSNVCCLRCNVPSSTQSKKS